MESPAAGAGAATGGPLPRNGHGGSGGAIAASKSTDRLLVSPVAGADGGAAAAAAPAPTAHIGGQCELHPSVVAPVVGREFTDSSSLLVACAAWDFAASGTPKPMRSFFAQLRVRNR